jgi:hypothetical protein
MKAFREGLMVRNVLTRAIALASLVSVGGCDKAPVDVLLVPPAKQEDARRYIGYYADRDDRGGAKISSDIAFEVSGEPRSVSCDVIVEAQGSASVTANLEASVKTALVECTGDASWKNKGGSTFRFECGTTGTYVESTQRQWTGVFNRCCTTARGVKPIPGCEPERRVILRLVKGELAVSSEAEHALAANLECVAKKVGKAGVGLLHDEGRQFSLKSKCSPQHVSTTRCPGERVADVRPGPG